MTDDEVKGTLAKAQAAKASGNLDEALKLVSQVLAARPQSVDANWTASWILASKQDTALAIGQFERTMKLGLDAKRLQAAKAAVKRLKAREE
ncbi:MAG: hypothetical protein ABFE16_06935 [Armatimonadia bacterium]